MKTKDDGYKIPEVDIWAKKYSHVQTYCSMLTGSMKPGADWNAYGKYGGRALEFDNLK